ncbi:MAG: hypothetical protein DMF59_04430 [Acidobacteria bacterium]|nr:MAG: hypothetical protein DMF59_04430 [Acidobacteriota bacterium]
MPMRRFQLLILSLIVFASCASSKQAGSKPKIAQPSVGLQQEVGPAQLGYPYGPIEIKYNFAVQNNAAETITLIRVDIQSINPAGGAYSLRHNFYNFKQEIPANSVGVVTFWARGFGWGRGLRESEPVSVRGVAYFESPSGTFQKVFIQELSQYPD